MTNGGFIILQPGPVARRYSCVACGVEGAWSGWGGRGAVTAMTENPKPRQ